MEYRVVSRFLLRLFFFFFLTEVLPLQPEDWPILSLKAIIYSGSWVRKLANIVAVRASRPATLFDPRMMACNEPLLFRSIVVVSVRELAPDCSTVE